jgi:hypothetical protein
MRFWQVVSVAGALGSAVAHADSIPEARTWMSYDGTAVDADDGRVLYRESHYVALDGDDVRERLVLYRCADGTPFARKRVAPLFGSPWLPEFDMTDARLRYREGFDASGATPQIFVQEPGKNSIEREALDQRPKDLVGDAGFDRYVQDNWDKLVAGETLHFKFLVPSRLDYLGFKVRQIGEQRIGDRPVRVFRLALGGLLGLVVSGIDVSYDAESRVLMRFQGLTNVRDQDGENYVARIDFPSDARRDESGPEAHEAARTVALATSCPAGSSG